MFSKWKIFFVAVLTMALVAGFGLNAQASPSLDIRHAPSGPVLGGPNGPIPGDVFPGAPKDPESTSGQWFWNLGDVKDSKSYEYRTHEFYDNQYKEGGSEKWSTRAIEGYVTNLEEGLFTVKASITNDTFGGVGEFKPGENSHHEYWEKNKPYIGTMFDVKLTTDFADAKEGKITAIDYDQLAWFCQPKTGSFKVPTYDFGDIAPGETVTKDIQFSYDSGVEGLTEFLKKALEGKEDIFLNRTTSLKISDFIDGLVFDDGTPYPVPPGLSSDVSVFHAVPIPCAVYLLCSSMLGLIVMRKKIK